MQGKIVAIAGGEYGQIGLDGKRLPYETGPMDEEIVRLTEKEKPNFLLLAHAQPLESQEEYFQDMKKIYEQFGCFCKDLKSIDLINKEKVNALIDWADIIYEGGGNTLEMINLWKEAGFDKILRTAWENGKVMCGVSAGANCWFKECLTDSLKILYGDDQPLIGMECLGFVDAFLAPHCDIPGRSESVKDILNDKNMVGISLSNCTAIEIIADKYRILTSSAKDYGIEPYGFKTYWKDGKYIKEQIDLSSDYKDIKDLLKR